MNAKGDPGEERPHHEDEFDDRDQEKNEKIRHGVNHRMPPRTKMVRVLKGIIRGKWKVEGGRGRPINSKWDCRHTLRTL